MVGNGGDRSRERCSAVSSLLSGLASQAYFCGLYPLLPLPWQGPKEIQPIERPLCVMLAGPPDALGMNTLAHELTPGFGMIWH